jgi:hypothetical protein
MCTALATKETKNPPRKFTITPDLPGGSMLFAAFVTATTAVRRFDHQKEP